MEMPKLKFKKVHKDYTIEINELWGWMPFVPKFTVTRPDSETEFYADSIEEAIELIDLETD